MPVPPLLIRLLLAAILTVLALLVPITLAMYPSPTARAAVEPPAAQTLEKGWQFRFDPDDVGMAQGWRSGAWDQAWGDVTVPHVFNPTPVDSEFLGTVGWYRMHLVTPAT